MPVALSVAEIEAASKVNEELKHVRQCTMTGNWKQCWVTSYLHVKDEICVSGDLVLRGNKDSYSKVFQEKDRSVST